MLPYFHGFTDPAHVGAEFQTDLPAGADILIACYDQQDYEGYAFVLYRLDGKLYEVNGSHCSCHGLEDQWEPEEVVPAELLGRGLGNRNGGWGDFGNGFSAALEAALNAQEEPGVR